MFSIYDEEIYKFRYLQTLLNKNFQLIMISDGIILASDGGTILLI